MKKLPIKSLIMAGVISFLATSFAPIAQARVFVGLGVSAPVYVGTPYAYYPTAYPAYPYPYYAPAPVAYPAPPPPQGYVAPNAYAPPPPNYYNPYYGAR